MLAQLGSKAAMRYYKWMMIRADLGGSGPFSNQSVYKILVHRENLIVQFYTTLE